MTLAAVQAAKKRHQQTLETLHAGTITLAGTSHAAAVILKEAAPELMPDGSGSIFVQRGIATVKKAAMTSAPARGTVLRHGGLDWSLDSVHGQHTNDRVWTLRFHRIPGTPA